MEAEIHSLHDWNWKRSVSNFPPLDWRCRFGSIHYTPLDCRGKFKSRHNPPEISRLLGTENKCGYERYLSFNRSQLLGERVDDFVTDFKKFRICCEFGELTVSFVINWNVAFRPQSSNKECWETLEEAISLAHAEEQTIVQLQTMDIGLKAFWNADITVEGVAETEIAVGSHSIVDKDYVTTRNSNAVIGLKAELS